MEINFALAISLVLMLVMMAVVLVVGASFVELVISLLIPFVLCAAGAAALFGVLFLLSKVLPISKKLKSTVQMIIILVAIVVVPISYFLYTFLPMQGHCFDISKTEQVICYDRLGPDKDVWMKDPENVAQFRERLAKLRVHRYYNYSVPWFMKIGEEKVVGVLHVGLLDKDGNKLGEYLFRSNNTVGIYDSVTGKTKWFKMYRESPAYDLDRILDRDILAASKARIEEENQDKLDAFAETIRYEDGAVVIPLAESDFVFSSKLELEVTALAQSQKLSYTKQQLNLLELAEIRGRFQGDETVRVPLPQERLYYELEVVLILDGVEYSYDLTDIIPEELMVKDSAA